MASRNDGCGHIGPVPIGMSSQVDRIDEINLVSISRDENRFESYSCWYEH